MKKPWIVMLTESFSSESLEGVLNNLYKNDYFVTHILEGNDGYRVVATINKPKETK